MLTDRARQLESDEEVETAAADASEEADGKSLYARSDLIVYMLYIDWIVEPTQVCKR